MATLQRQTDMEVFVEFFGFCFQESDDEELEELYPEGVVVGEEYFMIPRSCRVDIRSAGHTQTITLATQVWDGPPEPDKSRAWEAEGEEEIYSPSGELAVCTFAGMEEEYVELGASERRWRLRLYSTGRSEAARLATQGVPHGVEQYLAQFWPADA